MYRTGPPYLALLLVEREFVEHPNRQDEQRFYLLGSFHKDLQELG